MPKSNFSRIAVAGALIAAIMTTLGGAATQAGASRQPHGTTSRRRPIQTFTRWRQILRATSSRSIVRPGRSSNTRTRVRRRPSLESTVTLRSA